MAKMSKKIIGAIILLIVAIGIIFAYYAYNKPAIDVENSPGLKVDAVKFYTRFSTDLEKAKKNYVDKIVEVAGQVVHNFQNQQKQTVILLSSGIAGAYINCTMEGTGNNIKIGSQISIKGICTGMGDGDIDLQILGDIYLIRCYESK